MWQLDNQTPFAAERTWVRDRQGAETWVVVVKATFLIGPDGRTDLAPEQAPPVSSPVYRGEPDSSSLIYDCDMVRTKLTTDILLNGSAYAPRGKAAGQVDVTLKIGDLTKTLRVFGDRVWKAGVLGPSMSAPEPFESMPITYERAFGGRGRLPDGSPAPGWDVRNPVGTGYAFEAEHILNQKLPNIEDPKDPVRSWRQRPEPAGFAPIPGHWMPRASLTGTYDARWEEERFPLLPDDFDDRFYQCAPIDQQAGAYLRGGESVELVNLSPSGSLRFTLPRIALGFSTDFGTETERHAGRLHTIIFEPDVPRVSMVWQTSLMCHPKVLKLWSTTITQKTILKPAAATASEDDEADEEEFPE